MTERADKTVTIQSTPQTQAVPIYEDQHELSGFEAAGGLVSASAPPPLTPRNLLFLQRTIGNQAVQRLLKRTSPVPGTMQKQQPPATRTGSLTETRKLEISSHDALNSIQRRRIPDAATLASDIPTDAAGLAGVRPGVARLLSRAWEELPPANQPTVTAAIAGLGITFTTSAQLRAALNTATRQRLLDVAQAIRTVVPGTTLGDPTAQETGPRPGTTDTANLNSLITTANIIFDIIASGVLNASIGQVFGTGNVADALTKYADARTRMNQLHNLHQIVADRSGYGDESGVEGQSDHDRIRVTARVFDNPGDLESVVTLLHESMHAGNSDVDDRGYIESTSFTALPETDKIHNAAHFEVVPRRMFAMPFAFAGQTFIPAGTVVGGVAAPPLTQRQQALRDASERFRNAWDGAADLYDQYVRVFSHPSQWNTFDLATVGAPAGTLYSNCLPYWSNVEGLTIHTRLPTINPAGTAAQKPVTAIDIALAEGVVRKLAIAQGNIPNDEAAARAFEAAHATTAERQAAAVSVAAERNLLIKLILRVATGRITGTVARDLRVVNRLAQARLADDYLQQRPTNDFT